MAGSGSFLEPFIGPLLPWFYVDSYLWTAFGLLGNAIFATRFLVQWISSERLGRLVVPPVFWHLSFWGSVITLVYAFHVDKLPVILGYVALPVMYGRNLLLLAKEKGGGESAE